jgi:wyosine [tRNA(Phe)-imidazoG37] synthetase (radical SAM superfamily)
MKYIFGPVKSRRFGNSLGINIVPFKVCSYDCIYCEVGKTTKKSVERKDYVNINDLIEEFKVFYDLYQSEIDVITITGQGEPTLNLQLEEIITLIGSLSTIPVLVLTNGSLLYVEEVRKALSKAHMVCTSLDAVDVDIFRKINNPALNISIATVIDGLIEFSYFYEGDLFIEVLLVEGFNDKLDYIDKIIKVIRKCKYHSVQINTVFRPPAYYSATPIDGRKLHNIQQYMEERGVKVQRPYNGSKKVRSLNSLENYLLSTVALRPLCVDEIRKIFDVSVFEIDKILQSLILTNKISVINYENREYFVKSSNRRRNKDAI